VTGEEAPAAPAKVEEKPVVEEEKEVVDILDAKAFKNLVELRNALQDKGIDVSQITNVKAAEALAKKNGYNYTVEKNS
jgi:arginine repressor